MLKSVYVLCLCAGLCIRALLCVCDRVYVFCFRVCVLACVYVFCFRVCVLACVYVLCLCFVCALFVLCLCFVCALLLRICRAGRVSSVYLCV